MAISTVLGRFVIPIYLVLGERLIDMFARKPEPAGNENSGNAQPPPIEQPEEA
jgi:hypothetical protein